MENLPASDSERTMHALREGIKAKYRLYHRTDRDRFPDITYNTNRANYKPLQTSFEEEFYVMRGLDQRTNIIRIPSTHTLALLFTDENYVPSKKLLDTCLLYAGDGVRAADIVQDVNTPEKQAVTLLRQSARTPVGNTRWRIAGGSALLAVILLFALFGRRLFTPAPANLVITRPTQKSAVPQELVIEGTVSNAETVWLTVHDEEGPEYWVQPPIKVQNNGVWLGVIYVGGITEAHVGLTYQIRAFVNPTSKPIDGKIYWSWPEAELSSEIVEVIRK